VVLIGDKGYDDQKLRQLARDHDIQPLINHRECTSLHKGWNTRLDSDLYHQRNINETVNAAIKRESGAFVRSRLWWKQFRELVIKCIVHNFERSLFSTTFEIYHRLRVSTRPNARGSPHSGRQALQLRGNRSIGRTRLDCLRVTIRLSHLLGILP
jgi:hypothetical protein